MTATSLHRSSARRRPGTEETSVLVVALDSPIPLDLSKAEVLVVAPALNSWLRHWVSDEDAARSRAQERVAAWLDRFERTGVHAQGRVGDADPLQAIADALPTFPADEIVIAGQSERSTRLADELVAGAHRRFRLPVVRGEESLPTAGVAP
jgi:hypothetical protein